MILIENTPPIPGLTFRHFQGDRDFAQMAAVLSASEIADKAERTVSAGDLSQAFQRLQNCDPAQDILIAEVAGQMIGYTRGWWEEETTLRLFKQNGFLIPAWRRKGIGQVLLLWMEHHLRDRARYLPPSPAQYYQINVSQFQPGKARLVERAGYSPVRYFYKMERSSLEDIHEYQLPDGLETRPVLPAHYPAIWKSIDETSQDEWGYSPLTEADYQNWLADAHFQPDLWQVAWDLATDQVAGHVCTFIDHAENQQFKRKRGYTEGVGVARAWRRRGLARALISRSLQAQKDAGMTESALVADSADSGVTQLYKSCGFEVVSQDTIYRKPL